MQNYSFSNRDRRQSSNSLVAKKRFGQHFLVDEFVLEDIIRAANLAPDARVLEIGPGHGVLTSALADAVPNGLVLAVEADRDLVDPLRERFKSVKQAKVIAGDILGLPLASLLEPPYQIVSNLPYSITSPVITKFLLGDYKGRTGEMSPRPTSMTILIQKEVAERLTAEPGNRERGVLTVLVELFGSAELIRLVPPESFDPVPRVESAVVRIDLNDPQAEPGAFLQLLKAGFSNKRRQLHNSLAGSLRLGAEEARTMLESADINPLLRAEQLDLGAWLRLFGVVTKAVRRA